MTRGSDRIDRFYLRPDLWCVPPVMELDSHTGMIRHPFANHSLCRRVTAMAVDDQDSFEPLLCHYIENVAHDRHIRFDAQCDRSGNARNTA